MNARDAWVQRMLEGVPRPIPRFGSPEWLALEDGDRRKTASVVVAAAAWAQDGDEREDRLRLEVLALSRAYKQAEDAEYVTNHRAWAKTWAGGRHHPDPNIPAEIESEFRDWIRGAA